MANHHKGRPNTVELHHDALDRTIWTTPGAARVLAASGWHEPSEEPPKKKKATTKAAAEKAVDSAPDSDRPEED